MITPEKTPITKLAGFMRQENSYDSRGVLFGAMSKGYDEIVEFTAFEDFISFDRKGKKKVERTENHKIKVTIKVNMVCGAVN